MSTQPSSPMTSTPVVPCSCAEGWKPEGWAYCAECYEGQIERLSAENAEYRREGQASNRLAADNFRRALTAEARLAEAVEAHAKMADAVADDADQQAAKLSYGEHYGMVCRRDAAREIAEAIRRPVRETL